MGSNRFLIPEGGEEFLQSEEYHALEEREIDKEKPDRYKEPKKPEEPEE